MGQILKRRRELSEKELKVKKNSVVKPTSQELNNMWAMLRTIEELNVQAHANDGHKRSNILYRMQKVKNDLNIKLDRFISFTYEKPIAYNYKIETHEYSKIDKSVQQIIDKLDSVRPPKIEEVEKRKLIFGDFK